MSNEENNSSNNNSSESGNNRPKIVRINTNTNLEKDKTVKIEQK
jgi:hypothetical protein